MEELVTYYPFLYVHEMRGLFQAAYGIQVSDTTLRATLSQMAITHKKMGRIHMGRLTPENIITRCSYQRTASAFILLAFIF